MEGSLAGITGPWAAIEKVRLGELRQTAIGERIDVMLALGCHQDALAELARLIREYPLQERFRGQMMLALYRCGRQADALAAFADARRLLAEQLGIDPGAELRRLHQQILSGDAALDPVAQGHRRAAPAGHDTPMRLSPPMSATVPWELPADVDTFIGRTAELAELDEILATAAEPGRQADCSAAVISAVAGSAAIGKTTLALRWGHRARDAFPDGDLYVNLRGYDPGEPLTAGDALARFLRSLGVADRDIPVDEEERAARYRSLLDGRRMLIVLDNAATTEQVRLLLPGVPSCVVLVTSRDSLAGLVARDGARRLELDLLSATDATALLRALIGARAKADPAATAALAGQCARLPLALRVAAELATARPALSLADLVDELGDEQRRLDLLDAGGDARTAVRGVFSWSCQHLPADVVRAFRLASLHPGPDFDAHAVAALAGTTVEHAAGLLRKLAQGHLIQAADPGRYAMHDLLSAYARHLASTAPGAESQAALARLLGYYLATAAAAMDALVPAERDYRPPVPLPAAPLLPVATTAAARAWLDSERDVLVRVARYVSSHGAPEHAIQLSAILQRYLLAGHYIDAVVIHKHACSAARQVGDRAAEAHALEHLGVVYNRLGRYREGAGCLKQALGLFREVDDLRGEGLTLTSLAGAERRYSCYPKAAALGRQALGLFLEIGDRLGEALARMEIGVAEWQQGGYRQAGVHFEQARILYRAAGDTSNEAHALSNLGMINELLGRYPEATQNLQRALAMFRRLGQREGEASTLTDLGSVACRQGQYADAASYQEEALALSREIGERTGEAEALNGLGEVLLATGQPDQARARYYAALTLADEIGEKHEQSRARNGLGAALLAAGIFVQSDGKIVVAGSEDIPNEGENAAVVRFSANGTLDTNFGSGGEVTTHFPSGNANLPGNDTANTVLVQADGKILIGGGLETCVNPRNAQCISETALALLNPDGTLDTSFGSGGFAVQNADSFGVIAMGEDSAGNIFVQNGNGGGQPTLGEYSSAGLADSTVTFPPSSTITVSSTGIGFQPNGTYAEGQSVKVTDRQSGGPTAASVVVNSLPSGVPVAGFSNPPFDYANEIGQGQNSIGALAFQSNGDVVAAGTRCSGTGKFCSGSDELGVARLTATGNLDSTFGAGGVTTFSFTSGPAALAIQSNGDILIAFQNCSSSSCESSIARLLG